MEEGDTPNLTGNLPGFVGNPMIVESSVDDRMMGFLLLRRSLRVTAEMADPMRTA